MSGNPTRFHWEKFIEPFSKKVRHYLSDLIETVQASNKINIFPKIFSNRLEMYQTYPKK